MIIVREYGFRVASLLFCLYVMKECLIGQTAVSPYGFCFEIIKGNGGWCQKMEFSILFSTFFFNNFSADLLCMKERNNGIARMNNTCVVVCDFFDGLSQNMFVVQSLFGDDTDFVFVCDNIGPIKGPSTSCFYHCYIHLLLSEKTVCKCDTYFKITRHTMYRFITQDDGWLQFIFDQTMEGGDGGE